MKVKKKITEDDKKITVELEITVEDKDHTCNCDEGED